MKVYSSFTSPHIDYCVMYCVLTALICEIKKIAFINLLWERYKIIYNFDLHKICFYSTIIMYRDFLLVILIKYAFMHALKLKNEDSWKITKYAKLCTKNVCNYYIDILIEFYNKTEFQYSFFKQICKCQKFHALSVTKCIHFFGLLHTKCF